MRQFGEAFIDRKIESNVGDIAAAFFSAAVASIVREYLPHCARGDSEEVCSRLRGKVTDSGKLQISLVHERRRTERAVAVPLATLTMSELPHFLVKNGKQRFKRGTVAALQVSQKPGDHSRVRAVRPFCIRHSDGVLRH